MSYDTPTAVSEYKGRITPGPFFEAELQQMAKDWPLGTVVTYTDLSRTTYEGTVTLDEPANIPGDHLGEPSAWCWHRGGEWVCVRWHNDLIPYIKWLPAPVLRPVSRTQQTSGGTRR